MADETEVVRPLTGIEIKDGIAQKIAEAIRASLDTTCWLYGAAHAKFKADWRVNITLSNPQFLDDQETFVDGAIQTHHFANESFDPVPTAEDIEEPATIPVDGVIPYTPPNVFRKENGLAIPTVVKRDDGSTEQKAVMFKSKPGRPKADAE